MLHTKSGSHWPFDLRRTTRLHSLQIELGSVNDDTKLVTQMLSQISSAHMDEVGLEVTADSDCWSRKREVDFDDGISVQEG